MSWESGSLKEKYARQGTFLLADGSAKGNDGAKSNGSGPSLKMVKLISASVSREDGNHHTSVKNYFNNYDY